MIAVENVNKVFKSNKNNVKALVNLNVRFPDKGMYFITGKSGSGKTTLLNIISLLDSPSSGNVSFNGVGINDIDDYNLFRKNYFGLIFQDNNIFDSLTVYENLSLIYKINNKKNYEQIDNILDKLNILSLKNTSCNSLSGGEKSRVSIARAVLNGSKVIIADEPTASLDKENTKIVFDSLRQISKDILVIISTHDTDSAHEYGDGEIHLNFGEVVSNSIKESNSANIPIKLENNKMQLNGINYISKKILFRQKFRHIFTIFFYCFTFVMMIVSLSSLLFNSSRFVYTSLSESNLNEGYLSDDVNNYIAYNSIDLKKISMSEYPSIKEYDLNYNPQGLVIQNFKDLGNEVNQEGLVAANSPFNLVVIDLSYIDNQIAVTDYVLASLLKYGKIDATNISDCLGKTIGYGDFELKIVEIIKTDYLNGINVISVENDFQKAKMNYKTYMRLFGTDKKYFDGSINDLVGKVYNEKTSKEVNGYATIDGESSPGFGAFPKEDNEIVISLSLLHKLDLEAYNLYSNLTTNDKDNAISKKEYTVDINVGSSTNSIIKTFYVTGLIFEVVNADFKVVVNQSNYDYLINDSIDNLKDNSTIYKYIKFGNERDSIKLLKDLSKIDGYIYTTGSYDIYLAAAQSDTERVVYKLVFYISLAMTCLVSVFFSLNIIKHNKKNIGILSSLGMANRDIRIMFFIDIAKTYLVSFLISNIIYVIYIVKSNDYLKKELNITLNTYSYNLMAAFIVYGGVLLINILGLKLYLYFLQRRNIRDIIYK